MGNVQIWLSQGSQRFQIPVNPESISVSSPFGYEEVNIASFGEFTIIGEKGLAEVSFSSFFPAHYMPGINEYTKVHRPIDLVNRILSWQRNRRPIRITITGTLVNYEATIRDFNYEAAKAGAVGDVYYELTLKEYRPIGFRYIDKSKPKAPAKSTGGKSPGKSASSTKPTPKTHTVVSGDSLSKISLKYYKTSDKWREIYDKNKAAIGKNPNALKVGQKLVLP